MVAIREDQFCSFVTLESALWSYAHFIHEGLLGLYLQPTIDSHWFVAPITGIQLIIFIHVAGSHTCKFVGFYIGKQFNSHRTGLAHQHDRRFMVLEHQYGSHDVVMWKSSIATFCQLVTCNWPRSIYHYSNMAPELAGENWKFLLSQNSQKKLGYNENNTNIEVYPESVGAMLEFEDIEQGPLAPSDR